jgi:hypothetical protein
MKKFTYVLIIASLLLGVIAVSPAGAKQGVLKVADIRDGGIGKNRMIIIFNVNKGVLHNHHPHAAFFIKRNQLPMYCEYKRNGNMVVCEAPKRLLGRGGQEATLLINGQVFQFQVPRIRPVKR